MTALPDWVDALPRFHSDQWWRPIVCTDSGTHPLELLGVAYETPTGGVFYDGPHISRDGARGDDPDWPRSPDLPDVPHLGSINMRCPACGHTARIPRVEWAGILSSARQAVELPMIDASIR